MRKPDSLVATNFGAEEGASVIVFSWSLPSKILGVLSQHPLEWLILPLFIFVGFVYSGTTVDSSAYVMASISSKKQHEGQEPVMYNRLFWALVLGATALVIMNIGGLEPLKTTSLVVGLPLALLMVVSFFSLLRWLEEDFSPPG